MQISALVPEIFEFEKWAKYANEMTDDVITSTLFLYQTYEWGYLGQFPVQNLETWQADSSIGNTPMASKNSIPMAAHSFPVPTHLISIC